MADGKTIEAAVPRMKTKYNEEVFNKLKEKYDLKNVMQVPKIEKIVVNMGIGGARENKGMLKLNRKLGFEVAPLPEDPSLMHVSLRIS